MVCGCRWVSAVLALIIIVLAFWPSWLGLSVSTWVIAIAALIIIICSFCKNCSGMKDAKSKSRR